MTDEQWPRIETKLGDGRKPKMRKPVEVFTDDEAKEKLEPPLYLFIDSISKMAELFCIDSYGIVVINDGQLVSVAGGGREDITKFLSRVNVKMIDTINDMMDDRNEKVERQNEAFEAEKKAAEAEVSQQVNGETPPPRGSWS